jgi:polyisoprenoid-binding protein YceI
MTRQFSISALTCAVVAALIAVGPLVANAQEAAPLSLASARVSLAGTSNIHEWTASTTEVRITRLALGGGVTGAAVIANPAGVEAFEIAIRAASLSSPKEGLDKNMHKALKAAAFKDITFRLLRLEAKPSLRAVGVLTIAGVEREVVFDLKTAASASALTITGDVSLLMTDFGIAAPKAMLGMLKTDPKVTVTFEVVLAPHTLTR